MWPALKRRFKKEHVESLITALVDFHKSQCFFAITIQIAALFLYHQTRSINDARNMHKLSNYGDDLIDGALLVVLATGAFIPLNLTYACVARFGRQSWYLILLTFVANVLGTATLICSIAYQESMIPQAQSGASTLGPADECAVQYPVDQVLFSLCGSNRLQRNFVDLQMLTPSWIWAPWILAVVTFTLCIAKKVLAAIPCTSPLHDMLTSIAERHTMRFIAIGVIVGLWLASIGAQLYLFGVYFQHDLISYTWSFGQLIAVTVWVPSLVEYAYIEYCESKCALIK